MIRIRKLTPEQRERARALKAQAVPVKVIAREFGVAPRAIEWHIYPKIRETARRRYEERRACT